MASQGPLFPTLVSTVSAAPESIAWNANVTTAISADDGSLGTLTAATYDTGTISQRVHCRTFVFTIPAGAVIDGIIVEIERRTTTVGGNAIDNRMQLLDAAGALVGTNKSAGAAWPTTLAIATFGSSSDTWGASPTQAMVTDVDFGVAFSAQATVDNTDIAVDFIRMTIHYTEGGGGAAQVPYRNRYAQLLAH